MFSAQSHNQLLVSLLFTPFVKNTHMRLATIERFASFPEAAGETIVDKGKFEDTFQGFEDGHLGAPASGGGDFDLGCCLGGR